ncbi:MAG: helix-turn-helix domain-containing protein [Candidatus Eremiobacterota bacterium]
MSLGKTISRLRTKKGWTQAQLAEQLGMHQNHVNRLENDKMKPRPNTLERLAEVLDASIDDLLAAADTEITLSWAKDDPELAGLLLQIPILDEEQRNALKAVLRSMVACQEIQRIAGGRRARIAS